MNEKQQVLAKLNDEFNRWEELLVSLSEEPITAPLHPSTLSIKDEIAHLRAWQQRSIARMESVLANRKPEFPKWPAGLDPESEEPLDQINAGIYEAYRDQPWSSVHRDWRVGFLRFVELGEAIPEKDLLDAGKYPWLGGYAPAGYLFSSYEHHDEHLDQVLAWRREHGNMKTAA